MYMYIHVRTNYMYIQCTCMHHLHTVIHTYMYILKMGQIFKTFEPLVISYKFETKFFGSISCLLSVV